MQGGAQTAVCDVTTRADWLQTLSCYICVKERKTPGFSAELVAHLTVELRQCHIKITVMTWSQHSNNVGAFQGTLSVPVLSGGTTRAWGPDLTGRIHKKCFYVCFEHILTSADHPLYFPFVVAHTARLCRKLLRPETRMKSHDRVLRAWCFWFLVCGCWKCWTICVQMLNTVQCQIH